MASRPHHSIGHRLTYGDLVLERLAGTKLPAGLAKFVGDFKETHAKYSSWEKKVKAAEDGRDEELGKIAAADAVQDASVDVLADAIVGAGLAPRNHPFQGFSKKPPSEIKDMAWILEAAEIGSIVKNVLRAKPGPAVKKAARSCKKKSEAVKAAIKKLAKPQADYAKALRKRDALLPGWILALAKLERAATGAWADDPASVEAIFAAPTAAEDPVHHRSPSPPKPPEAPPSAPAPGTT